MPTCILLMPLDFCPFESSLIAFFLNFNSGSFLHSVFLCERHFNFNSRTEKNFGNLVHTDVVQHLFWYIVASWEILTLVSLLAFDCGMGSFKYNTLFTLLPFHGSFVVTPLGKFFSVKWMEPQNTILDFSVLSYFTGITQNFKCVHNPFR